MFATTNGTPFNHTNVYRDFMQMLDAADALGTALLGNEAGNSA